MMEKKELSLWSPLEISEWLGDNGLPQDICDAFQGKKGNLLFVGTVSFSFFI